jgi:serine/threonine protein kinase/WD40 repeat protein
MRPATDNASRAISANMGCATMNDAPENSTYPPAPAVGETAESPGPGAKSRPAHKDPESIGPYRILERIGEGGMGIVYRAEQREPVRRIVALKVIKLGMDTKEVVARFDAERQALAMLSHPNVAKVLDAGMTDQGRPYFAMEFVPGVPLTDYCNQNKLTTRQRLELFIPVCNAIQHAHQKGIIHRDLKPSNVLVQMFDGRPVPKVIDFGIAKATNSALTQHTLFTQTGAMVGTPEYMSPEQAMTSGLDVDTRTDIYSLGVILYELLTGTLPFDPKTLRDAGLEGMARMIRETEPQKPSTRFTTLPGNAKSDAATRHHTDVHSLKREISGDLDWIVLKAMEKDRMRRYETANGLAMDIQRHLNDEPVLARPPSSTYRFRKMVRRNKLAIGAIAAVVLALSIGLAVSTFLFFRESKAYRRATSAEQEQSRLRQEAQAAEAEQAKLKKQAQQQEFIARQRAYASDMNRVQQALSLNKLGQAQELLYRQKPLPGQSDLRAWEWRYLWSQCQSDALAEICREPKSITSMSLSHDGGWLALGQLEDGGLSIWDLQTRQRVMQKQVGDGQVTVAFSPRESLLAFSGAARETRGEKPERDVYLWNGISKQVVAKLPLAGQCMRLLFSEDGRSLVALNGPPESRLTVWRIPEGIEVKHYALEGMRGFAFGAPLAITRDLTLAAYAAKNNELRVLDLATGKEWWKATVANEYVLGLAFSPDGKILASGGGFTPSPIELWDASTGKIFGHPLEGHRGWVGAMVFWPDGKKLASASSDQTIRLWDISDLQKVPPPRILRGHKLEVWQIALMSDNRTLISGSKDGSVLMWDTTVNRRESESIVIPGAQVSWRFTPDSKAVLTMDAQGHVVRRTGERFESAEALLDIGKPIIGGLVIYEKGLVVALYIDGRVQFWDLARRSLVHEAKPFKRTVEGGSGIVVGSDDVLITDGVSTVAQFKLATLKDLKSWTSEPGTLLALSPDGRQRIELGFSGEGNITDIQTARERPLHLNQSQIPDVAFSADGQRFAVASYDGYAGLWETSTLRSLGTLRGFLQGVHSVSFSPDGRRIAAGSGNKEAIKLWDLGSYEEVLTLEGTGSSFNGTTFSPDGNVLGSMNNNGVLHLWTAPSWEQITAAEKAPTPSENRK